MTNSLDEKIKALLNKPAIAAAGIATSLKPKVFTDDGWVSGPRIYNLRLITMDIAHKCGLEYTFLDRDKGWIRETIYYRLKGTRDQMNQFYDRMRRLIGENE